MSQSEVQLSQPSRLFKAPKPGSSSKVWQLHVKKEERQFRLISNLRGETANYVFTDLHCHVLRAFKNSISACPHLPMEPLGLVHIEVYAIRFCSPPQVKFK